MLPAWFPEEELRKKIQKVLKRIFPEEELPRQRIILEHPANPKHGDFATNIALVLAESLKKKPLELAELIAKELPEAKAVAPGFINFYFSPQYLIKLAKEDYIKKLTRIGKGKTVVIDYSAPNIAKSFGIGHLRSTNIGQAVYNLYRVLGWRCIGDNHLGDWGTQFGTLIYQVKSKDLKVKKLKIEDLERLYVEFHRKAERDSRLEEKARAWFKKLENGDAEAKKIWQACVDISLKEFRRIYSLLGVKVDYAYAESFYEDKMPAVLADARRKGVLRKSRGALVVKVSGMKTPAMLVKSDGATTYLLRDLAAIKYRVKRWRPDLIVYEVGADQKFYFRQLFAVAEMLEYMPQEKLFHLAHGMIRWPEGKFSTRKGKTIHLEKVLKEAVVRAGKLTENKRIARAVGIGGVKFNDLKQEPGRDIIFDWNKILTLEGYSAPYLQYTYARCSSVLKKRKIKDLKLAASNLFPEELALLRIFYQFPEIILAAAGNFAPHLLAQYLFVLAQKFNLFYQKRRILGSQQRLFLTAVTARILKKGLQILNIEALEKM